jgi:hypothetical protein
MANDQKICNCYQGFLLTIITINYIIILHFLALIDRISIQIFLVRQMVNCMFNSQDMKLLSKFQYHTCKKLVSAFEQKVSNNYWSLVPHQW